MYRPLFLVSSLTLLTLLLFLTSPGLKLCKNWLYSYLICVVHCESHRFYEQNLAAMQHCLPK